MASVIGPVAVFSRGDLAPAVAEADYIIRHTEQVPIARGSYVFRKSVHMAEGVYAYEDIARMKDDWNAMMQYCGYMRG